jgi:hypothetical protein
MLHVDFLLSSPGNMWSRAQLEMQLCLGKLTFSLVARSSGSLKAAFSSATQESRSEMVSGRVYGWRLRLAGALRCWSSGMITNCLWRAEVGERSSCWFGLSDSSVVTLFGLSVSGTEGAGLSSSKSRGILGNWFPPAVVVLRRRVG